MDKQQKLQALQDLRDPSARMNRLLNERANAEAFAKLEAIKGEKGDKGDKGDAGANGQDGQKGDTGEKGDKGEPGKDGRNGIDGTDGKDGTNGKDGINGKDADESKVIDTVFNTLKGKKIQDIADPSDLVTFLKRGGFRGGGLSSVSVDGTTITGNGTPASPLVAVGGSGVTNIYNEFHKAGDPVNSSNTIYNTLFPFVATKIRVYYNGARQALGIDYTETASSQITFTTAPVTGSILFWDYEKSIPVVGASLLIQDGTNLLLQDGTNLLTN